MALNTHNIRFKSEFNYVSHQIDNQTSGVPEERLRANLVLKNDLEGCEKPLTIVIEAQGKLDSLCQMTQGSILMILCSQALNIVLSFNKI